MEQWEIPSCSICYDRLLTNLSLLPNCGHIYHKNCLKSWIERINFEKASCPLCRKSVDLNNIISLNYSINKSSDFNINELNNDTQTDTSNFESTEIADLKLRLNNSSRDNLELLQRIHYLENDKDDLQKRLNEELKDKNLVIQENKELKFSQERNKTTINGLSNKVLDLKEKLQKLEYVSRYLEEKNNIESSDIRKILKPFNNDEKINILVNRIEELDNTVTHLDDLYHKTIIERDNIDNKYKETKREFKKLYDIHFQNQQEPKSEPPSLDLEEFLNESYTKRRKIINASRPTQGQIIPPTPEKIKVNNKLKYISTSDNLTKTNNKKLESNKTPTMSFTKELKTPDRVQINFKQESTESDKITGSYKSRKNSKPKIDNTPERNKGTIYTFFNIQKS